MEKLEKLKELIEKELKEVENKGLTTSNLETTSKLVDILKDLKEVEEGGDGGMYNNYKIEGRYQENYRDNYRENYRENYRNGGYGAYREDYGRPYMNYDNYSNPRGGYGVNDPRMRDHLDGIAEGAEMYEYGRDRYQHGGSEERLHDGLEKLMYAVCMFVESTMDFAQSPQEKEIIRKHIQKIRNI